MRLRLKHSPALAAAAMALACGLPAAQATTFGSNTGTATYNAQTIAINNFAAVIPSARLIYFSNSGQSNSTGPGIPDFTVTWTTTGTGTAFAVTGALTAANVTFTGGTGGTCNLSSVVGAPAVGGQTITVAVDVPAGGTGAGCLITLVSTAPAAGLPVSVTGLNNLGPSAVQPTGGVNPSAVFGSFTAAQPAGIVGLPSVQDVITVAASGDAVPANNDTNPQPALSLSSANSWAVATTAGPAVIDLTGIGAPAITAGKGFQRVASGVLSVTRAAALGTITIANAVGLLDARFANACCNNAGNAPSGATPLAMTFSLTVNGDFQTITQAYLRPGPNVNDTLPGATPGVERTPLVNQFNSVCTDTTGTGDIISTPGPAGANFNTLSFGLPAPSGAVNGAININQLQYAVCVVTNGSNIIADTIGNTPSTVGAGGATGGTNSFNGANAGSGFSGGGTSASLTATVVGIATPLVVGPIGTNTHLGWDIVYGGTKAVFAHVFPASIGYPSTFRLVNTGMGTYPVYAVLQKDGSAPISVPGSFAAMTPFSAYYVSADAIAAQGGTTLGPRNTITLLTPASPNSLQISHFTNNPSGDVIYTSAGSGL